MRKREWLLVFFPIVLTWGLDRISKNWAASLSGVMEFGPISFVLHHNHGAMLGLFTELPNVLRIVTLSTGGAFILCTYAIIQYLLPIRSLTLRSGLSFLLGGIIGNVTDRIIWGYVVDFIVVGTPSLPSPAFNLADAFQWIGYIMIITAVVREGDLLWPKENLRKDYWVNRKFQLRYSIFLMAIGLGLTLVGLVFSYTYLRVTVTELVGNNRFLIDKFIIPFAITYAIICVSFCTALFAIGKYVSHRIAGPVFAFEKFLEDILNGTDRPLRLRAGDEFRELEILSERIRARMKTIRATEAANPQAIPPKE